MMAADRGAVRGHYGQPRGKAEGRMQKEESRRQGLGPGYRAEELRGGILEHALGEGVIKFLTVRNLICRCLGGGYRNSRGRQGRVRRMLLAGRALDCGRGARPLRIGEGPGCVGRRSVRPGIMPLVPLCATCATYSIDDKKSTAS